MTSLRAKRSNPQEKNYEKNGTLILAIGLVLGFSGCKTETEEVTLEKIEITAQPSKTEYFVGEELDTTGLEVTATYSDESSKVVTGWTTTGYDKEKAGEQTVEISYTENEITQTAGFDVTVKAIELTKIEVTTEPAKKEYFVGAKELDLAGMVVTATYSDGTTADVTKDITTSGFDSSKAVESQTITVSYGEKTATFTVKINPVLLTGIAVTTQPTKKDYHIGDEIDLTGMVVTANYNDGSSKALASNEYTVTGFDSTDYVNDKEITVTYNEKTDTFKISVLFNWYETPEQLSAGTPGTYGTEGTYVLFGVWPQDVVPVAEVEGLALDETAVTTIERGYLKYVKGSDGNYYVKHESKWYKVMPIKWRVADTAYKEASGSSQGKLLVAESILTANVPYYEGTNNHRNGTYPNNYMHSQIRAYLNGISYNAENVSDEGNWLDKGFLQTAFTSDAAAKIITTKVDNSKQQMSYDGTHDMKEDYACGPTDDKIFLLSEKEVVQYSKSTEAYDSSGQGNSRIRVTTDFAKAYLDTTDGYSGDWWLRSPCYEYSYRARYVGPDGRADISFNVHNTRFGVVPALSISF